VRFQRAEAIPSVRANDRFVGSIDVDEPAVLSFDEIPGPQGRLRTALAFYRQSEGFRKQHKLSEKLFSKYGPIFKENVTEKTSVVHIMEPKDFETVFRAEGKFPKRTPLDFLEEYRRRRGMSPGLESLSGEQWLRVRQALAPKVMRPKVLEENIDNFNAVTREAIERMAKMKGTNGEIPDLEEELSRWSTESVGTFVFDTRVGLYEDPPNEEATRFIQAVHEFFESGHNLLFAIVEKKLLPYVDTPSFKRVCKASDTINELGAKFLNKKIEELEVMADRQDDSKETKVVSLLSYLLAKKELTPQEITQNAVGLFGGGVDTTATSSLWLLYNLARHPAVQEKLHQEIHGLLGKDGEVSAGSLAKLSYLKACVKESARVKPVFLANRRVLDKDVVLSGYLIPAKTIIQLDFYATAVSERHFKNALEFKPERWLREIKKEIHSFAFLPFGFGPRMCIGSRIAELEMYLLGAKGKTSLFSKQTSTG